jgi:hypothetical protein
MSFTKSQWMVLASLAIIVYYILKPTQKEHFDDATLTKITNVSNILQNEEFRDYLMGLMREGITDPQLNMYENYVYLRKLQKGNKLTNEDIASYFEDASSGDN